MTYEQQLSLGGTGASFTVVRRRAYMHTCTCMWIHAHAHAYMHMHMHMHMHVVVDDMWRHMAIGMCMCMWLTCLLFLN